MAGLADLEARRAHELRLTPDRALESLDEAAAWLQERGMLTLMPCCSLPSLFAACHEEPYAAGKRGFAQWPKTKYWWGVALGEREGAHRLRVQRGKGLIVSDRVARLCDPLCRAALADAEAGALGPDAARVLAHLDAAGPSLLEELQEELALEPRALKRVREPLERVGAVVSRQVVVEPHRHTSQLSRWDQLFPAPSPGGMEELVAAGVRAAVLAPEREVGTWFSWPVGDAVERLVAEGRLTRVDGYVTLARGS